MKLNLLLLKDLLEPWGIKFINKLDNIVSKYNNKNHITITMKPVGVKSNTYIDSSKEINDKNPKFDDNIRISNYNFFCQRLHSKLVRGSFCD